MGIPLKYGEGGAAVPCAVGFAKAQPKISVATQRKEGRVTTNWYNGGSAQVVLQVGEAERPWIKGPFYSSLIQAHHLVG